MTVVDEVEFSALASITEAMSSAPEGTVAIAVTLTAPRVLVGEASYGTRLDGTAASATGLSGAAVNV